MADDPDREAILARRKRFIAIALSGLTSSCGDDGSGDSGSPMPCLDVAVQTESAGEGSVTDPSASGQVDGDGTGGTGGATGGTGGTTSASTTDAATSTGTDTGDQADSGSTGRPRPCLAPKG